jgi:hypothetical protein
MIQESPKVASSDDMTAVLQLFSRPADRGMFVHPLLMLKFTLAPKPLAR